MSRHPDILRPMWFYGQLDNLQSHLRYRTIKRIDEFLLYLPLMQGLRNRLQRSLYMGYELMVEDDLGPIE